PGPDAAWDERQHSQARNRRFQEKEGFFWQNIRCIQIRRLRQEVAAAAAATGRNVASSELNKVLYPGDFSTRGVQCCGCLSSPGRARLPRPSDDVEASHVSRT